MSSYTETKEQLLEIQRTFNECINRALFDEDYCNQFQLIIGIGREDEKEPEKMMYNHAIFGSPQHLTPIFEKIASEPVGIVGLMMGIAKMKKTLHLRKPDNDQLH